MAKFCPHANAEYRHGKIFALECDKVSSAECIGNDYICPIPSKQPFPNKIEIIRE